MATTRLTRHIRAPRGVVYRALLDAEDVQQWMVPEGMTSQIHAFDAREGGEFRISLTYDMPTAAGKTTSQTDSFHGRFVKLVPDNEVVQVIEFETDDPAMKGETTITYSLADADDGTELILLYENLPPGVPAAVRPRCGGHWVSSSLREAFDSRWIVSPAAGRRMRRWASSRLERRKVRVRSMPSASPVQPSSSARWRRATRSVSSSSRRPSIFGLTCSIGQRTQASLHHWALAAGHFRQRSR